MHFNFIIVGQGLAGSLIALAAQRRGLSVLLLDQSPELPSASRVAAGLLNPISGQRFTVNQESDILFPFNSDFYAELSETIGTPLFRPLPILRLLQTDRDLSRMQDRLKDPHLRQYLTEEIRPEDLPQGLHAVRRAVRVAQGGAVNYAPILQYVENTFPCEKSLVRPEDVRFEKAIVRWNGHTADGLIYAGGAFTKAWEAFSPLPCRHCKGEILTLRIPGLDPAFVYNAGVFVLPLKDDLFRVGSSYDWNTFDATPTEEGKSAVLSKLEQFLSLPYSVVDHQAGIRPITPQRVPLVGSHPTIPRFAVLTGFGSKGSYYGPYLADRLLAALLDQRPEPEYVSFSYMLKRYGSSSH